eukprot:scpid55638/ scgid3155/ 
MMRKVIKHFDDGKPINEIKVTLIEALRSLQDAWSNVEESTIRACFRHCGFTITDGKGYTLAPDEEPYTLNRVEEIVSLIELRGRSQIDGNLDATRYTAAKTTEDVCDTAIDEDIAGA